jgi:hypothetical protein
MRDRNVPLKGLRTSISDFEDSEECLETLLRNRDSVFTFQNDTNDDIFSPVKKRFRRSFIEDESEDENLSFEILPVQWDWKESDNDSKIWEYTKTSRIKGDFFGVDRFEQNEIDFFNLFFDNSFWDLIVTETNRFAEQTINCLDTKKKMDENWEPIDLNELKVYFALCIIMAQVKKPTIQMNWSKREIIETPIFTKCMPFKRFSRITRFLHFNDNIKINGDKSKLGKVAPVINYFNEKFKEVYIMEENVSIDESLMKFKGRLPFKLFNTSKRARFGIKFYKLCESSSGYCFNFKIYEGNDKNSIEYSASESVVFDLLRPVINRGHTLYIDNWYSSPKLFFALIKNKTNVLGTVRCNRKNMPIDFLKYKLKKGECITRSCNGILALKWKDKRDVHFLSTKHESAEMVVEEDSFTESYLKSKCIIDYNMGMLGVDRQDQLLASYPVMRKFMKGYRKIFFYLCDMAFFNSYVLFNKSNKTKKQNYTSFRLKIAETILKNVLSENNVEKGFNEDNFTLRLKAKQYGHFPKHIDPTASKKNPTRVCKVCSKHNKRSETTWKCKVCQVALHLPDCFERYHTVEDY